MTVARPFLETHASGEAYRGARVSLLTAAPGAYAFGSSAAYRIAVHTGQPHHLWEWQDGRRHAGPHRRGDVSVTAVGESRRVRWDRPSALVAITLSRDFVSEVAAGLDVDPCRADIVGSFSRRDAMVERLAFALVAELEDGLPSGPLFGESVATALAARLLRDYGKGRVPPARERRGGLAPRTLATVVAYVRESLDSPLALADLAKVAHLSPFHFLREFRASAGLPPHAYILRERVDAAMRLILVGATISDAAAQVGFSSQGHLTRHMRRLVGITPGAIVPRRRSASRLGPMTETDHR